MFVSAGHAGRHKIKGYTETNIHSSFIYSLTVYPVYLVMAVSTEETLNRDHSSFTPVLSAELCSASHTCDHVELVRNKQFED